ncbi:hypothetical protein FQZ97_976240 [compost metagenome]
MRTHTRAYAPDFPDWHGLEQLVAANRIADVYDATSLLLPALGSVIGELGQCLGGGDANADWDAGLLPDLCLYLTAYRLQWFG